MKYILILLVFVSFSAYSKCYMNLKTDPRKLQEGVETEAACKELGSSATWEDEPAVAAAPKVAAVPGTGEKADTACKDVVQTQAEKDAAAKAKQGQAGGAATK
jgi:hypothetical protein